MNAAGKKHPLLRTERGGASAKGKTYKFSVRIQEGPHIADELQWSLVEAQEARSKAGQETIEMLWNKQGHEGGKGD